MRPGLKPPLVRVSLVGSRGMNSRVKTSASSFSSRPWRNSPMTCSATGLSPASKAWKATELKFADFRSTGFVKKNLTVWFRKSRPLLAGSVRIRKKGPPETPVPPLPLLLPQEPSPRARDKTAITPSFPREPKETRESQENCERFMSDMSELFNYLMPCACERASAWPRLPCS